MRLNVFCFWMQYLFVEQDDKVLRVIEHCRFNRLSSELYHQPILFFFAELL